MQGKPFGACPCLFKSVRTRAIHIDSGSRKEGAMSEKITMPKNVQSFLYKYGSLGSKEQDSAFWKEFRKAANSYADVQSKRICDLEHALAEERKHYKKIEDKLRADLRGHPDSELWGESGLIAATMRCVDAVDTLTEQRDRLVEGLKWIAGWNHQLFDENTAMQMRDKAEQTLADVE